MVGESVVDRGYGARRRVEMMAVATGGIST